MTVHTCLELVDKSKSTSVPVYLAGEVQDEQMIEVVNDLVVGTGKEGLSGVIDWFAGYSGFSEEISIGGSEPSTVSETYTAELHHDGAVDLYTEDGDLVEHWM